MNNQIEAWRVQQYTANVYALAQQKGARIAPSVRTEVFKGKAEFFDRMGLATAVPKTQRNSPTPNLDLSLSRRMVTTTMYEWATLVDRKDKLQNIHDPENQFSVAARWALGRSMDDVLITAALGSASYGESGSSSQTLGTGQGVMAVAGSAGSRMNVTALLKTKLLFDENEVEGPRYFVHSGTMLEAMLEQTQVTSADYNSVRALVRGEIDTYLGFKFIHSERMPLVSATGNSAFTFDPTSGLYKSGGTSLAGTEVSGIAFVGDGLLLGKNEEAIGRIDERADYSYSMQVYASMDFGAVRMEETKVVQVMCLP